MATVENVELDFKPITRLRRNSIVVVFHEAASIRRAIGFQSGNSRWERGCPSTSTRHASLSNSSDFFDRTKILLPLPTIVLLAIKIPLHALLPSENSGIGIGGKSTPIGEMLERGKIVAAWKGSRGDSCPEALPASPVLRSTIERATDTLKPDEEGESVSERSQPTPDH